MIFNLALITISVINFAFYFHSGSDLNLFAGTLCGASALFGFKDDLT